MILLQILGGVLGLVFFYVLFLTICALAVDPRREYENHSAFYRFLLDTATAAAMKLLRIRIHVTGREKLPEEGKLLFISNHCSNFDPLVTWYVFRKWRIAFISKKENFRIPIFGRFIRKCCFMAIDRENPRNALVTINKAADLLRREEVSVGIYPEGTRSKTGEMLPFRNGAFKIAQKAGAGMVVLGLVGTQQIHKNTPFRRTDVYVDVLRVYAPEELKDLKTETIGAEVRRLILENTEKRTQDGNRIHTI